MNLDQIVICGNCLDVMATFEESCIDTIITDPPYGLSFMGKEWDHGVPGEPFWREALRVAKPGAMLLAFGGTRTYHRLTVAIEDAGWEIRDCMMWLYGSGFPKSHDISKAIDKSGGVSIGWFGPWLRVERERRGLLQRDLSIHFPSKTGALTGCVANWELGLNMPTPDQFNTLCAAMDLPFDSIAAAEREILGARTVPVGPGFAGETYRGAGNTGSVDIDITAPATDAAKLWDGWGTALKPAWEPIIVAMKPLDGTFANNALTHGVAGLNIDGGRVETEDIIQGSGKGFRTEKGFGQIGRGEMTNSNEGQHPKGRWPANMILDEQAGAMLDEQSGETTSPGKVTRGGDRQQAFGMARQDGVPCPSDTGGASRFFYCAKASRSERGEFNTHPTVKPLDLMAYLCKLTATPTGGVILDPFCGSGSTLVAATKLGRPSIGIDLDPHYCEIARRRIANARGPLFGDINEPS